MKAPLHVRDWGGSGPNALVLLHGFLGRSDDWAGIAPRLAGRWRVLAFDLPGHGSSTGLPEASYSPDGAAHAVVESLDALGLKSVSMVGYSMGGRIAGHAALQAPGRMNGLVLESAHPGLASRAERDERLEIDRERARRLTIDLPGFLEQWYRSPMFGLAADDERRLDLVRDRLRGDPAELARALVGMSTGRQEPVGERLRAVGVPTLLVAGGRDPAYARMLSRVAREHGFELHIESDAAHTVHMDRPDAFASFVAKFLESKNPAEHDPD